MKSFLKPTLASILAITFISLSLTTQAADKKSEKETKPDSAPAAPAAPTTPAAQNRAKPYGGTISAVDKTAMTITVKKKEAEKTFSVTSSTKIMKNGKPATLDDAVIGDEAGISFVDAEGGKAEARSIRIGAKPAKPETASKATGEKKPKKEKTAAADKPTDKP